MQVSVDQRAHTVGFELVAKRICIEQHLAWFAECGLGRMMDREQRVCGGFCLRLRKCSLQHTELLRPKAPIRFAQRCGIGAVQANHSNLLA